MSNETQIDPSVSSRELEMSIGWARENPQLFYDAYEKFFATHRDGWLTSSKARSGFLTLIATRITE